LYAENLCVADGDVSIDGFTGDSTLYAAALFNVDQQTVDYAYNIHDKVYPASTTKILTALVAINHSNMDDVVTVSKEASASSFDADAQVCGLQEGDQLTMEALLNGLLLHSGNDSAVAIAEYVGGSIEGFSALMNEQAQALRATNTHFVSPNGLHDEEHYTTAYDLYLIFNECIKHEEFLNIIQSSSYTADITGADGSTSQTTWYPTSYYAKGAVELPYGATVIGGKTGYTGEAGNCLILLDEDDTGNSYISIVMGAETKDLLYEDMSAVINQIPNLTEQQDQIDE
jgi:D-alanyl-D-alanine carboxypeptidase